MSAVVLQLWERAAAAAPVDRALVLTAGTADEPSGRINARLLQMRLAYNHSLPPSRSRAEPTPQDAWPPAHQSMGYRSGGAITFARGGH
jgi:hypothetical protein